MQLAPSILLALTLGFVSAVSVPAALAETAGAVDRIFGFRDVRLGSPVTAFDGLTAVESVGPGRVCYERRGEDLRLDDGVVQSIRYCFADGGLEAIVFEARGERNTAALFSTLQSAFGPGRKEVSGRGGPLRVLWQGQYASAWYGEPRGPDLAQARIWMTAEAPPPGGPPGHVDPPPAADVAPHASAGTLQINRPRRVQRGQVATVTIRYRDAAPPATVRVVLPPEMTAESTVPEALVSGPEVVWENLEGERENLKLKVRVSDAAQLGATPILHADLFDSRGGHSEADAPMRIR